MATEKPLLKKKRFWGALIAIASILLKIFVPGSGEVIDQVSPLIDPILDNLDLVTDSTTVGGGLLYAYGVWDAKQRKKKNV